ncbi:MAG TPA: metallophosphoesterase family protein [Candidatus Flavonifractor merdigallinarum]|uniref:Metallophosphoesterase family protein n=1 Tax=Candidatus Flavonifractor merdigallinarum TaxID=2838589 RepID=A0A9D1YAY8_9FIRM|nr:metallophosphoesterase family protein [Candidatus Flavonifractor merdigallinarum]
MNMSKKVLAGVLTGTVLLGAAPMALASPYNDSSLTGGSEAWSAWTAQWDTVAADYTKVSLTPGADETQLNFAWYSKVEEGKQATPVVHFGTDKANLQTFTGTADAVDTALTDDVAYQYNHVTVTGLQANSTYYYTVERNGVQSEPVTYQTQDFSTLKILYVGDPQVGASKGQTQGDTTLTADAGAANLAARNDAFAWDRTLDIATAQNPDLNFIISAGDQVNKTGKAKEEEYAGYLSASALASLPVATTIGNHDSLNADYLYHFNNPNTTQYGKTQAGGDYYYSYGAGLFIVLNTNNYNVAEHEKAIQEAIASAPDAKWRIVTIHQDIYGSGLDHSDTDGMILRTQLTPIFDQYDIDVVLQGHDHTYSRTKLLYGDGQTHGTYEFRLNEEGTDYDWDNAYNTQTDEKIPLYPEEGDEAGTAAHDAFQADNGCYTIESVSGTTVTNPQGILYMTANSASGSKFYELIASQQDYVANRSQNWLPSYSVISLSEDAFTIDTYQITDDGKTEKIDETFTIQKTEQGEVDNNQDNQDQDKNDETTDPGEESISPAMLEMSGETYYRLRDVAALVSGTKQQFDVLWNNGVTISTGTAYTGAVPYEAPTNGTAQELNLKVDGKAVTASAVLAGGNYYVTADFLATLGVSL